MQVLLKSHRYILLLQKTGGWFCEVNGAAIGVDVSAIHHYWGMLLMETVLLEHFNR
jgi:hypothetical protein